MMSATIIWWGIHPIGFIIRIGSQTSSAAIGEVGLEIRQHHARIPAHLKCGSIDDWFHR